MAGARFNARGVGVAGSPIILIGFTKHVAWGMTALGADQADLFLLKTDDAHPNQYELDGTWRDMQVREESIKVSGGEPVTVTVRFAPTSKGGKECIIETGNGLCDDVTCTGAGDMPPSCSVAPESLAFGTVRVGQSADLDFTITNTGGGMLIGSVGEACGDYSILSGGGPYSLGAGISKTVTVQFSPQSAGEVTCSIETNSS